MPMRLLPLAAGLAAMIVLVPPVPAAVPPPAPATAADLQAAVRQARGKVVLLNAWASWCVPCREEMPDLLRLRRELGARGLELVLVTTDFDEALPDARTFLGTMKVDFPTFHKKQKDMEFIDGLCPDWSGSLPFTMLFDRDGRRVAMWEGRETYEAMKARVVPLLQAPEVKR